MEPWNTARATVYGAAIGLVAAAFKLLAPWGEPHSMAATARELVGAALRNVIARRLIWPKIQ
jgi:hypothetical protein